MAIVQYIVGRCDMMVESRFKDLQAKKASLVLVNLVHKMSNHKKYQSVSMIGKVVL